MLNSYIQILLIIFILEINLLHNHFKNLLKFVTQVFIKKAVFERVLVQHKYLIFECVLFEFRLSQSIFNR